MPGQLHNVLGNSVDQFSVLQLNIKSMELFVATANSFNQLVIVTKTSALDVETVLSPSLDTQGLVIRVFSFLQALFSK